MAPELETNRVARPYLYVLIVCLSVRLNDFPFKCDDILKGYDGELELISSLFFRDSELNCFFVGLCKGRNMNVPTNVFIIIMFFLLLLVLNYQTFLFGPAGKIVK